jgi:hypothetical protein
LSFPLGHDGGFSIAKYLVAHRVSFGLLNRQTTIVMEVLNALIPFILQALSLGVNVNPRGLKQLKVVLSAFAKIQTNDLTCVSVDEHLTFEGVLLFLAGIEFALQI